MTSEVKITEKEMDTRTRLEIMARIFEAAKIDVERVETVSAKWVIDFLECAIKRTREIKDDMK